MTCNINFPTSTAVLYSEYKLPMYYVIVSTIYRTPVLLLLFRLGEITMMVLLHKHPCILQQ